MMQLFFLFFWVLAQCRMLGGYQCFGKHRFSPVDGVNMFLRNAGIYLRYCTAPNIRRVTLSVAVKTSNLTEKRDINFSLK